MPKRGCKVGTKKVKTKLANASSLPAVPLNTEDTLFLNQIYDSQLSHKMEAGPCIHSSETLNIFSAPGLCNNGSAEKVEHHWISTRTRSKRKAQGDQSNADVVIPIDANGIISQVITEINDTATGIDDEFYIDGQVSEIEHDVSKVSKQVKGINVACSRSFGTFNWNKKAKYSNKLSKASQLLTNENSEDTSASRKVEIRQKEQPTQSNKKELSAALDVIKEVMEMDEARPFNNPVNSDVLPEYYEVIHTPVDFGTIRCYLEHGHKYMKSEDVYKDVSLIWANCYKYNKKGDYILHLMKRVKKKFMKCWLAAGLCLEMPNNGHLDLLASTVSTSGCLMHHNGTSMNTLPDTSNQQLQDQSGCHQAHTTPVMSCQELPHADMARLSSSQCQIHLSIPSCSQLRKSFTHLEYSQPQNNSDNGSVSGACDRASTGGLHCYLSNRSPSSSSSSTDLFDHPSDPIFKPTSPVQAIRLTQLCGVDQQKLDGSAADTRRRGRGKTVGWKISHMRPGERFHVDFDRLGRPIGKHRPDLITLIGTLVRNTDNIPLQVKSWRQVPGGSKNRLYQLVQEKFEWEGDRKDFVERQLSNSFRNYRHRLKKQFFDPFPTAEERIAHRPHDISVEDWDYLCNLWSTSEFQALSSKNKVNRQNLEMNHATGRRSFAQIEVDEIAKSGKIPSRMDMFELTRQRKKGGWIDERAEEVAALMRELCDHTTSHEEVYTRFLGPDRSGHIQRKGWRRAITNNNGSTASHDGLIQRCDDARKEVEEARRRAELAEKRAEAADGRAAAAVGRAEAAEKKAELAEFSAAEAKESCSMMQKQVLTLMTELRSMMTRLPLMQHAQTSQRQSS